MITLQQFKDQVFEGIKNLPSYWRKGQKVFNFVDTYYGVARKVQFEDKVDCFYIDENINEFLNHAYEYLNEIENERLR